MSRGREADQYEWWGGGKDGKRLGFRPEAHPKEELFSLFLLCLLWQLGSPYLCPRLNSQARRLWLNTTHSILMPWRNYLTSTRPSMAYQKLRSWWYIYRHPQEPLILAVHYGTGEMGQMSPTWVLLLIWPVLNVRRGCPFDFLPRVTSNIPSSRNFFRRAWTRAVFPLSSCASLFPSMPAHTV